MKALTIIQPWATLIASGHKMNETRSWKTNYRGEVLIHAGKNPKDYTSGCYIDDPDGRHFQEAGITPNNFEDLPRGSIIGKATLVNCIHINAQNEPKQPAQPQINLMAALFGAMMQQAAQNQQEEGSEIESDDDE